MKLPTYQWLVQVFGGITVVLSLLLVAWELRQNTLVVSAQAILELNVLANAATTLAVENASLSDLLVKARANPDSLSESERLQYAFYQYLQITSFEAAYCFYSKGIIAESDYSTWRNATCDFVTSPQGQKVWEEQRSTFLIEFQTYVDAMCIP